MTVNELIARLQGLVEKHPDIGSNPVIVRIQKMVVDKRMRGGIRSEASWATIDYACDGSVSFSDGTKQRFTEFRGTPFTDTGRMKNKRGQIQ